jgi:hypothetical protein
MFNGFGVPVLQDEKALEIDGFDGCTALPLSCTLKNG